jgi:hypothetical protein
VAAVHCGRRKELTMNKTINDALVAEQDRIMAELGEEIEDETSYAEAAYRVMATVAPDLTRQRWERLTGLSSGAPCESWRQCCGWCNSHSEHCGRDDAEKDEVCDRGHCHYCDHYCEHYD